MLREADNVRQIPGDSYRRWFSDDSIDLIVWYSDSMNIVGFQLCYLDESKEKALTWLDGIGFSHNKIDLGEHRPDRHKMSPILTPDGEFPKDKILELFKKKSKTIDKDVVDVVIKSIKMYPHLKNDG